MAELDQRVIPEGKLPWLAKQELTPAEKAVKNVYAYMRYWTDLDAEQCESYAIALLCILEDSANPDELADGEAAVEQAKAYIAWREAEEGDMH